MDWLIGQLLIFHYILPFVSTGLTTATIETDSSSPGGSLLHMGSQSSKSGSLDRSLNPLDLLRRGKQMVSDTLSGESSTSASSNGTLPRSHAARSNSLYGTNSSGEDAVVPNFDAFRSVTVSLPSFFRHEPDKLSEDDLFKFIADLKRPSSLTKRLKCIPGTLKLDIAPCAGDDLPVGCLTPELARLMPVDGASTARPIKEVLEFPLHDVYVPHYSFRNLFYIYPRALNLTNRPGSARNIAIKVQLLGQCFHCVWSLKYDFVRLIDWLTDWLTVLSIDLRLIDWMINGLVSDCLIHRWIDWFIDWLSCRLTKQFSDFLAWFFAFFK